MNPNTQQGQVQTYTSPNGGTVPGAQMDQNNDILTQLARNQTLNPQQMSGVSNQLNTAQAGLAQAQTAPARQSYLNNGDLPAIQNNYDQLARQLYETDKAIAGSGQYNMTPPTDAISSAGVAASPLALTNSILQGNSFQNPNPTFGMQTRLAQNNSILDLLSTLNDSLAKEFSSRKNTYASNVKGRQSIVDSLMNILDKNSTVGMHNADLAEKYYSDNLSKSNNSAAKWDSIAAKLRAASGIDHHVSPETYDRVKRDAADLGIKPEDFDELASPYRNPENPYYQVEAKQLTGAAKTQSIAAKTALDLLTGIEKTTDFSKLNSGPFQSSLLALGENNVPGLVDKDLLSFKSQFGPIRDQLLNAISGATVGDKEAERLMAWIPSESKSSQKNVEDIKSLKNWLLTNYRNNTGQDYRFTPVAGTASGGGGTGDWE